MCDECAFRDALEEIGALLGGAEQWSSPADFLEDIARITDRALMPLGHPSVSDPDAVDYWEAMQ